MKDLKISKELLSEVLGIHTILMNPIIEPGNNIGYLVYGSQITLEEVRRKHKQINIYELAFKCKEWIISKEYHINTSEDSINNYIYLYKMVKNSLGYEIDKSNGVQFDSKGYIKNLFEACEWILKELKK